MIKNVNMVDRLNKRFKFCTFPSRASIILLMLCLSCESQGALSQVDGNQCRSEANETSHAYLYNPLVPREVWEELEPYFLPIGHPIKKRLDRFFQKDRATLSLQTFIEGGFLNAKMRKPTNIVIGRSARFKGYLFKVYLDSQPTLFEWDNWLKRIRGANAIKECIELHGFQNFTVPRKWIYPLPLEPFPTDQAPYNRKNFILIVEDMSILSWNDNLKAYKRKFTRRLLRDLHCILTEVGLLDSVYPDNIPFTKSGKIAFIDTEHHHHPQDSIPYHKLTRYFSEEMGEYWESLSRSSN
jgi:hypothetical protein